jgi:leucyl-tRNA synthetase
VEHLDDTSGFSTSEQARSIDERAFVDRSEQLNPIATLATMTQAAENAHDAGDLPPHRYTARIANEIEAKWQDTWESRRTFWTPNPTGPLVDGWDEAASRPKLYVLDMFPYPSGTGLHVGHPLGYIATDVYARFMRMSGYNVLHAMGYDAFGLPAEQYAVQTGQHPRVTTEANIVNMRRQLRALGLGHDPRRGVATTDVPYYRWTQWIFLQIFNAWYDDDQDRARPITELIREFESGSRAPLADANPDGVPWTELDASTRRRVVDSCRLAYLEEAFVNWCPALGTVLANEEVTTDGRSERGNHPVFKRALEQWMLAITSYADRLLADLDALDWPEPIKTMQRNWIGRSVGANVVFPVQDHEGLGIEVFTTRPDTLFGATYMVVAPEHPILDTIVPAEWPDALTDAAADVPASWRGIFGTDVLPAEAVRRYREFAAGKSELERQAEGREKTGVFVGAFARNPTNGWAIPIFVADYVLMGYGTGAIMAVPAHDQRDLEFATEFDLPIVGVVRPTDAWLRDRGLDPAAPAAEWPEAYTAEGIGTASANPEVSLDGLTTPEAKRVIGEWLERAGLGVPTVTFKLRDWLFSRQRYWGEPFPIVYDVEGPIALPESMLPVELPDLEDFEPGSMTEDDAATVPEPPLARAEEWVEVELDLGDGPRRYRRETNTMPQWAGSCWYFLRYLDPTNDRVLVDPDVERYWMGAASHPSPDVPVRSERDRAGGGVDLYVGGVEHAVLHLLYARFWHKVLYDLGHVSTSEPFHRLFNQGYIQAYAFMDERGVYVDATKVTDQDGQYVFDGEVVTREYGKMGKSLKNVVTPDDIYRDYGADTLRLYEMFMGPLDASRPWGTTDIAGVHRFLQRVWRNVIDEETGELQITEAAADAETRSMLHRTIAAVGSDMAQLKFNTAIARLFELNNRLTQVVAERHAAPREVVVPLVLMLAPLTPHAAEELWQRLGHTTSLAYEAFPEPDPAYLAVDEVEIAVQVDGKVRAHVRVPSPADDATHELAARSDPRIASLLEGATTRRVVVVPGRLVNFVLG